MSPRYRRRCRTCAAPGSDGRGQRRGVDAPLEHDRVAVLLDVDREELAARRAVEVPRDEPIRHDGFVERAEVGDGSLAHARRQLGIALGRPEAVAALRAVDLQGAAVVAAEGEVSTDARAAFARAGGRVVWNRHLTHDPPSGPGKRALPTDRLARRRRYTPPRG